MKPKFYEENTLRIRQAAIQVLSETNQSDAPVKLSPILSYYDVSLEQINLKKIIDKDGLDLSGVFDIDSYTIYLEESDSFYRKRFSIAHEIGHIVLKHPASILGIQHESSRFEKDANKFAAELLMPYDWLKTDLARSNANFIEIQKKYLISELALSNRITYTNGMLE